MSANRRSRSTILAAALLLAALCGCESTHEYYDVATDTPVPLTCSQALTCASDCAGDTACQDACVAQVCTGSSAAFEALETCQTTNCATECADFASTDCMTCMSTSCLTEYMACSSATCD